MSEPKHLDIELEEAREGLLNLQPSSDPAPRFDNDSLELESGGHHPRDMSAGYRLDSQDGEKRAKLDTVAGSVTIGCIAFCFGITWLMVLLNDPGALGWFVLHPLLQTLSLALFTYGILTLQPTSQADPKGKQAGLDRHQYTMVLLGFPVILVGSWAVWHNKELRGADHYQTWHATFGGLCLLWMVGQIILGAGSVWFNGKLFGGGMKAKALWKYHRLSGYILFPLMLFTVHLGGAWSTWATKNSIWIVRFLAFTVAPTFVVGGLYARARSSKMKFW